MRVPAAQADRHETHAGLNQPPRRQGAFAERAAPEGIADRIAEAIRDITKLRGKVELVTPGSLPNDGKVIEDLRSYR